jgi:hypothetical protein
MINSFCKALDDLKTFSKLLYDEFNQHDNFNISINEGTSEHISFKIRHTKNLILNKLLGHRDYYFYNKITISFRIIKSVNNFNIKCKLHCVLVDESCSPILYDNTIYYDYIDIKKIISKIKELDTELDNLFVEKNEILFYLDDSDHISDKNKIKELINIEKNIDLYTVGKICFLLEDIFSGKKGNLYDVKEIILKPFVSKINLIFCH